MKTKKAELELWDTAYKLAMKNKKVGYTPGPWSVDRCGGEQGSRLLGPVILGGTPVIAQVYHALGEGDANAKLISAAPEMFRLLVQLMDSPNSERFMQHQFLNLIEMVLVKAGGTR